MAFLLEIGPKGLVFRADGGAGGGTGQNRVVLAVFCSNSGLPWQPHQYRETGNKRKFARVANRDEQPVRPTQVLEC